MSEPLQTSLICSLFAIEGFIRFASGENWKNCFCAYHFVNFRADIEYIFAFHEMLKQIYKITYENFAFGNNIGSRFSITLRHFSFFYTVRMWPIEIHWTKNFKTHQFLSMSYSITLAFCECFFAQKKSRNISTVIGQIYFKFYCIEPLGMCICKHLFPIFYRKDGKHVRVMYRYQKKYLKFSVWSDNSNTTRACLFDFFGLLAHLKPFQVLPRIGIRSSGLNRRASY